MISNKKRKKLRKKALSAKCPTCGRRWMAVNPEGGFWCVFCRLDAFR